MKKITIGIPGYRQVTNKFYAPLAMEAAGLWRSDIWLEEIISAGSMMVDVSRNHIVDKFRKSKSEWLAFVDDDNPPSVLSISRLVNLDKTCATGVYSKRDNAGTPIAYISKGRGNYAPIDNYVDGEIFTIDSAGMGGSVIHRSVFDDIERLFYAFRLENGGHVVVKRDDVVGDILQNAVDEYDGKVVDGQLRLRVTEPDGDLIFPFFMLAHGLTEDTGFWIMAAEAGHPLWVDTGTAIAHIGEYPYMAKRGNDVE